MPSIPANSNIKHVFVLMLENGQPTSTEGVSPANTNTYNGGNYSATNDAANVMDHDPGHEFIDVMEQLCGEGTVSSGCICPG